MKKFLLKYWEPILLGLILVFAAYLRLYKISDYLTFLGDEGRDVLVVKRMIVDHKFTLLGPTASVGGFFLGPIYYYFMLPFLWLWHLDPAGPAVMVALFGIATVYLLFRLGKKLYGPEVGLIAASLYAVSPIVIAYSRSSWNPNIVPFFAIALICLLWEITQRLKPGYFIWIGIILGIGLQLHYLFLFLGVVTVIWLAVQKNRWEILKYIHWLILGFIIGYAPFLAFEVRHGFPNTQSIIRFVLTGKDTGVSGNFLVTVSDVIYRLFGRLVFRLPPPEQLVNIPLYQQLTWQIGTKTVIFISILSLILLMIKNNIFNLFKNQKNNFRLSSGLIFTWLFTIIILFGLYKKAIYDYYFGIFFPVPFILVALIFWEIMQIRFGKIIVLILLSALLWLNWQGRPFLNPPNRQLNQAKVIAEAALSKTDGKPFNFALDAVNNSDYTYRYFFEIWGRAPVTIETLATDPTRKTVTDQLIVICESECHPLGDSLWEIAGFGRAEIVSQWDVPFVKIYKLVHFSGPINEKN